MMSTFSVLGKYYHRYAPLVKDRIYYYGLLMRLHRPIGIFLLLWPTLWALWIAAAGLPQVYIFLVFVAGVILMRSAGVVLNDMADQKIDAKVERTRDRPLVTGHVSLREALSLAVILILMAFLLVLTMNRLTIILSVVALLLGGIYPFMKRYTYLPQFFLGLAFAWSIPMAFAAQTNTVPQIAWLLLTASVLWTVSYDTSYALCDRKDDLNIGVKSTAILFADLDRIMIGIIQLLTLIALLFIGAQLAFNIWFYLAVFVAAMMNIYQLYLIWDRDPQRCMRAFVSHNWYGAIIFIGICLGYMEA